TWTVATPTGAAVGRPDAPARVDLTGLSSQPRTLYIADALRHAPNGVKSEHDLRLCPNSSLDDSLTGQPNASRPNPCVNMGIDAGSSPSLDIEFRNGIIVDRGEVGLKSYDPNPSFNVEEAPLSLWDFDAEGFGNRRINPAPAPY